VRREAYVGNILGIRVSPPPASVWGQPEGGGFFDTLGAQGGRGTKQDLANTAAVPVAGHWYALPRQRTFCERNDGQISLTYPLLIAEQEFEESRSKAYGVTNRATLDARDIGTAAPLKVFNTTNTRPLGQTLLSWVEKRLRYSERQTKQKGHYLQWLE
jgi:hypothetical protein